MVGLIVKIHGANDNIFKVAGSSSKATQFTIMIHNGDYVSIDYGGAFYLKTNRLLRDTSGWYHFVVTVDTTLSTADNRIRLYINGVEETSFATRNNPNQDEDLGVNRTSAHTISTGDSSGFDGLLSNFYLIDALHLDLKILDSLDPLPILGDLKNILVLLLLQFQVKVMKHTQIVVDLLHMQHLEQ